MNEDPDPWEERLRFGQLFLRHLDTLGRPFLPPGQPPITVADYLEMLALGEMLAEADRSWAADPDYYRDAAYLHGALTARGRCHRRCAVRPQPPLPGRP